MSGVPGSGTGVPRMLGTGRSPARDLVQRLERLGYRVILTTQDEVACGLASDVRPLARTCAEEQSGRFAHEARLPREDSRCSLQKSFYPPFVSTCKIIPNLSFTEPLIDNFFNDPRNS